MSESLGVESRSGVHLFTSDTSEPAEPDITPFIEHFKHRFGKAFYIAFDTTQQ